jgi:hypothetical protein
MSSIGRASVRTAARAGDDLRRDGFAGKGPFGGGETGGVFAEAGRTDSDVLDGCFHAGYRDATEMAWVARAYLADVGFVTKLVEMVMLGGVHRFSAVPL